MSGVKHVITGAGGFLGTHLIEALFAKNPSDTLLSVGLVAPSNPKVRHFACDLLETEKLRPFLRSQRPDRIYHLAGSARVSQAIGMPEYFRSNFLTTESLLNCLEGEDRPLQLFFSSSVHVYGNQAGMVDEATPAAPNGYYGMSKYLAERALEGFSKRHPQASIWVGRLYNCIGPGQGEGFVTSDLTRRLVRLPSDGTTPLETGPLTCFRRFLDVRDAAEIIRLLLEAKTPPGFEQVNIASPVEMQIRTIVELLIKASGKHIPIHSTQSDENPFRGLQVSLEKLERLVPGFKTRPLENTLDDIWQWGLTKTNGR